MDDKIIQNQFDEIHKKLDLVLSEMDLQRRRRNEMEDLKNDMTLVAKDVMDSTMDELEGMSDAIQTGDILHLFKKLLRNVNNITHTFEQLESFKDMMTDAGPIGKASFIQMMEKLEEMDKNGYFLFIKELGNVIDIIIRSMSKEEIQALAKNTEVLVSMFKSLSQLNLLSTIDNAVKALNATETPSEKVSLSKTIKAITAPEMKQGVLYFSGFMKNFMELENQK